MISQICRNPLKSGQGFNGVGFNKIVSCKRRNPLKSGQGFNQEVCFNNIQDNQVVIPLNRVKVSTVISQTGTGKYPKS